MIFPLINGNYYSYANIELTVPSLGLTFVGVKAINYKDNLGRVLVRGTASQPIGVTIGRYEASGDIEMYLSAFSLLQTSLGPGFRQTPIFIVVNYGPNPFLPIPIVTDEIPGAYIGEISADQSESEEALTRKFTLIIPGQILWNNMPSIIEPATFVAVA